MTKLILVILHLPNPFVKALRLVAPTICLSSMFHLLTTLLEGVEAGSSNYLLV